MFRFDSGWRRNDDGHRSRMAKARSWTALHLQLPWLLAVARRLAPTSFTPASSVGTRTEVATVPSRDLSKRSFASSSLEDRVQLLGHRRDVPALLAANDAFVHPSREEPFGISILEAMAAGLPPIAYREAGRAEVIREGGLLAEPGDVAALADAMSRLARDPELCKRMGNISRQDVKARFSPKVEALRFARFLSSVRFEERVLTSSATVGSRRTRSA
jgi:glycosyltransferase involved in cell wall biosynthesis